jgi:predicted nucleic acid-binding protein
MTPAPAHWVVVDASVWVSRLVPHAVHHEVSRHWLERYTADGGRLVAPVILFIEVAGAIARRTGQPALAHRAVAQLWSIGALRVAPVDMAVGREATRLAADLRMRGADAIYAAVARRLRIPLVTWDAEQQQRAGVLIPTYTPAAIPC